jgi:uncharacterized protein (TIGR02145 family)
MAKNLNYADSTAMPNLKGNSWCYDNSADNCSKYGRLYTWTAAMNIASSYQDAEASAVISSTHQGACPAGWHIPTYAEWTMLENAVGGEEVAGTVLKSTSGWNEGGNGTDVYGFSALPAGNRNIHRRLLRRWPLRVLLECHGGRSGLRLRPVLELQHRELGTYYSNKGNAFSVRCVKD